MPLGDLYRDGDMHRIFHNMALDLLGDYRRQDIRKVKRWFEQLWYQVASMHAERDRAIIKQKITCKLCGEYGEGRDIHEDEEDFVHYKIDEVCLNCAAVLEDDNLRETWMNEDLPCEDCGSVIQSWQFMRVCKACQVERQQAIWDEMCAEAVRQKDRIAAAQEAMAAAKSTVHRLAREGAEYYTPEQVLKEDMGRCYLCGRDVNHSHHQPPDGWEVEHVIPRSAGGLDIRSNVRLAHQVCNRKKGARLLGELDLPFEPPKGSPPAATNRLPLEP